MARGHPARPGVEGELGAPLFVRGARGVTPTPAAHAFAEDVAPVFYKNCTGCHRPGGIGPFSLLDPAAPSPIPGEVVPEGEIERWVKQDPIDRYTNRLLSEGWADDESSMHESAINALKDAGFACFHPASDEEEIRHA